MWLCHMDGAICAGQPSTVHCFLLEGIPEEKVWCVMEKSPEEEAWCVVKESPEEEACGVVEENSEEEAVVWWRKVLKKKPGVW